MGRWVRAFRRPWEALTDQHRITAEIGDAGCIEVVAIGVRSKDFGQNTGEVVGVRLQWHGDLREVVAGPKSGFIGGGALDTARSGNKTRRRHVTVVGAGQQQVAGAPNRVWRSIAGSVARAASRELGIANSSVSVRLPQEKGHVEHHWSGCGPKYTFKRESKPVKGKAK